MVITYDVVSRLHAEDGLMRAALPALWENEYLATTFMKERKCPLVVRYLVHHAQTSRSPTCPAPTASSAKALMASADGTFARWKIATSTTANFAKIHFEFTSTLASIRPRHLREVAGRVACRLEVLGPTPRLET